MPSILPKTLWKALIAISLEYELGDSGICLRQGRLIRQEDDAEVLRAGLLAKTGAVDNHDVLPADELLHKNFVTLGNVDAGERIERSTRGHAAQARR